MSKCDCLREGRLRQAGPPITTPEGTCISTMICNACGGQIDFTLENFDLDNPDGKRNGHKCKLCGCQMYPGEGPICEIH